MKTLRAFILRAFVSIVVRWWSATFELWRLAVRTTSLRVVVVVLGRFDVGYHTHQAVPSAFHPTQSIPGVAGQKRNESSLSTSNLRSRARVGTARWTFLLLPPAALEKLSVDLPLPVMEVEMGKTVHWIDYLSLQLRSTYLVWTALERLHFPVNSLLCPICQHIVDKAVESPCCQQVYCAECIFQWLGMSDKCANCRHPLSTSMLVKVHRGMAGI